MEIMKIKEVVEESLCLLERKNIQGIKEQKQSPENLIFDDEEQGPGKKVFNSKIVNVKVIEYSSEHNLWTKTSLVKKFSMIKIPKQKKMRRKDCLMLWKITWKLKIFRKSYRRFRLWRRNCGQWRGTWNCSWRWFGRNQDQEGSILIVLKQWRNRWRKKLRPKLKMTLKW